MNITLRLSFLLCLPVMAMADDVEVIYKRLRQKNAKAGKVKLPKTTFGYISTDEMSSCYTEGVLPILGSGDFAACSRYWYNGTGGQSSTCTDNPYVAEPNGNTPANGNPADNTCLGIGDSPSCFVLEGVNDDEPILVRTSVAWDWSKYNIPFANPGSSSCDVITTLPVDPTINTCADILTNSSIPVVAADFTAGGPPGDVTNIGTTGQCYGPDLTTGAVGPVNPGVTAISSTVTFTIEDNDYVCDVTAGGRVCEMWGFSNGYGNNFDSQYIPFQCDDIGGKAYEGYIAFVFDHFLLVPVTDGIGLAPQIVLKRV